MTASKLADEAERLGNALYGITRILEDDGARQDQNRTADDDDEAVECLEPVVRGCLYECMHVLTEQAFVLADRIEKRERSREGTR